MEDLYFFFKTQDLAFGTVIQGNIANNIEQIAGKL